MIKTKVDKKGRIAFSFLIALIIVVCCFPFVTIKLPNYEKKEKRNIAISYISTRNGVLENLFNEQSDLLDTQSIFLPSKWSMEDDLSLSITNKSLFEDFPEETLIKERKEIFPKGLSIIREDKDILSLVDKYSGGDFRYFSIRESEIEKIKQRHVYLTIRDMRTGGVMLREEISKEDNFPNYDSLWRCGQFQHIVNKHMVAPEPLLLGSSGIHDIDNYIADYIKKSYKINNLPDGYYEVLFEP